MKYLKSVLKELKKVHWPTRKEVIKYTAVTVSVCLLFAACFWIADTGFLAIIKTIIS